MASNATASDGHAGLSALHAIESLRPHRQTTALTFINTDCGRLTGLAGVSGMAATDAFARHLLVVVEAELRRQGQHLFGTGTSLRRRATVQHRHWHDSAENSLAMSGSACRPKESASQIALQSTSVNPVRRRNPEEQLT